MFWVSEIKTVHRYKQMQTELTNDRQLTLKFLLCLGCYFGLHILLRVFISDSLDYDEAEQALLSQWLLVGYTEQPPLYTWLQHALLRLFDNSVFAISLLKNTLMFLTYVCVYFSGRIVLKSNRAAILAACSLLLIPQIGWESQRDMTHTTLVVFAASATFWQSLRMLQKQSLIDYLLLGTLLSIGILAKANFYLFTIILTCSILTSQEGRRVLLSKKMILTLLTISILVGPYLYWMYSNQDIVFSATHKFKRAIDNYYITGSLSLITNSFLFLTPLWFFWLVLFPSGFRPIPDNQNDSHYSFIARYLISFFIILLLVVLLFKVTYVKDRWLQPLLFIMPLFFFARLKAASITQQKFKQYLTIIFIAAITCYSAFAIRVAGASYIDRFCRLNYPFTEMSKNIREAGFHQGLIISDNRFIAGNMRLQFPGSTAIIPEYNFEKQVNGSTITELAIVWKGKNSRPMPKKIETFIRNAYHIEPTGYPVDYFTHIYKFGRDETVTLGVVIIPLSKEDMLKTSPEKR